LLFLFHLFDTSPSISQWDNSQLLEKRVILRYIKLITRKLINGSKKKRVRRYFSEVLSNYVCRKIKWPSDVIYYHGTVTFLGNSDVFLNMARTFTTTIVVELKVSFDMRCILLTNYSFICYIINTHILVLNVGWDHFWYE